MAVKITETILRDAHQSLIATRMTTDEMMSVLEALDSAGFHSLECWGGATFDSCIRFLQEDPWERLKKIREKIKKTKLQMLLRGQNLVGYRHYADDMVEYFVQKSIDYGIDIIRMFDALNDMRNLSKSLEATKKYKGHAQVTISYTISPVHKIEDYIKLGKQIQDMGADSLCIKDMAGLLKPFDAYQLVKELKNNIKIPIQLHTHYTTGFGSMTYLKAIEAGVDIVDTALSPFSMGTSQPPTETIAAALENTEYATGLDFSALNKATEHFKNIRVKYLKNGIFDASMLSVDVNALCYQVPGGMLSNLLSQLKQQNAENKLTDVLNEIPRVREDFGYPPLVTPSSQIVGTQAVLNVISGQRYKMLTNETKAYFKGEYGMPPGKINEQIQKEILKGEQPITFRPADKLKYELEDTRFKIKEYTESDVDVLTYSMFPPLAEEFFKNRRAKKYGIDTELAVENKAYPV